MDTQLNKQQIHELLLSVGFIQKGNYYYVKDIGWCFNIDKESIYSNRDRKPFPVFIDWFWEEYFYFWGIAKKYAHSPSYHIDMYIKLYNYLEIGV